MFKFERIIGFLNKSIGTDKQQSIDTKKKILQPILNTKKRKYNKTLVPITPGISTANSINNDNNIVTKEDTRPLEMNNDDNNISNNNATNHKKRDNDVLNHKEIDTVGKRLHLDTLDENKEQVRTSDSFDRIKLIKVVYGNGYTLKQYEDHSSNPFSKSFTYRHVITRSDYLPFLDTTDHDIKLWLHIMTVHPHIISNEKELDVIIYEIFSNKNDMSNALFKFTSYIHHIEQNVFYVVTNNNKSDYGTDTSIEDSVRKLLKRCNEQPIETIKRDHPVRYKRLDKLILSLELADSIADTYASIDSSIIPI